MAIHPGTRTSRRTVVTAALGAAGALAASAFAGGAPVLAAPNGNVQLGAGTSDSDNDSAAQTQVNGTTDGITTFAAVQAASGTGLYGYTGTGIGVLAVCGSSGKGLDARSTSGTGATGASYTGSGVYGYTGSTAAPGWRASRDAGRSEVRCLVAPPLSPMAIPSSSDAAQARPIDVPRRPRWRGITGCPVQCSTLAPVERMSQHGGLLVAGEEAYPAPATGSTGADPERCSRAGEEGSAMRRLMVAAVSCCVSVSVL
jgi:hypothetical protein